ncbi:hypothetical protein [Stenotrophomonas maltophilia]|uniref:hypothetical protein n=1 Tax=Stenotrophomonas maltophilia TaxID=40324 RepID=UPI0013DAD135|nr:hypothetical protein [Stenotrophomonas maltophilia]
MATQNERWAEATALQAEGLVKLLEETYPITPSHADTDREVWMKLGAARLIGHLKSLADSSRRERSP